MSEWRVVTLRELCASVDYGFTASASSTPQATKFLRITDIVNALLDWSSVPYVEATPEQAEKYRLAPRDIVIARTGATTGYSMWIQDPPDSVFASYLVRLKIREQYDSRFVAYALKSPQFFEYVKGVLGDKSAQPNASATTLTSAVLHVPCSLPAQRAISELLGTLDDKIGANNQIAGTGFRLAQAMYELATLETSLVSVVGDVLDLKYGKALPSHRRTSGNVPVYGSGGVVGLNGESLVSGPGVVIGRKGTVGTVHWAEGYFFPIDTTFYVVPKLDIPMEFIYFMLRTLGLDSMNSDSAVPGLNRNNVLALPVHLPDESTIRKFQQFVRPMFALRNAIESESAQLAKLRDVLLPKLISGELRVREAEKIVEDAT